MCCPYCNTAKLIICALTKLQNGGQTSAYPATHTNTCCAECRQWSARVQVLHACCCVAADVVGVDAAAADDDDDNDNDDDDDDAHITHLMLTLLHTL
jgi:hypothetical protein